MVSSWFDSAWEHEAETLDTTGFYEEKDRPWGRSFLCLVCQWCVKFIFSVSEFFLGIIRTACFLIFPRPFFAYQEVHGNRYRE